MKKVALLLVSLLAATCAAYSQTADPVLAKITDKLKELGTTGAVEKAYLHFDKPFYAAGDTIYFKAYVTTGERHTPTNVSGILHVDLITPANAVSHSLLLQLNNGVAAGDFSLPDTISSGNYRVRAYTNYMNNSGTDYYFDQNIPVGSVAKKGNINYSIQAPKPDLQFFAEGGNLLSGMENKVGFKAVGTNGLGINVNGAVVDNTGKEVTKFASAHLGMGTFLFRPEDGKTYKAKLTYANGTMDIVDLPKAETAGITLKVADTLDKLSIDVRTNKAYYEQNQNKQIYIVVYGNGYVVKVPTKLDSRILSMDVAKKPFGSGVVQTTVFSANGEPLSERLSFINTHDELNLSLATDKATYSKHENVQLNIGAKDASGTAVTGLFSVAVIDEAKVPVNENAEHTILNYLLLTSSVKGYIEEPNYYFVHDDASARANLDALMLTQGYRRFTWKNLLDSSAPALAYKPEGTLKIEGTVKTPTGQPAAKEDVVLRAEASGAIFTQTTDENGRFKFENLAYLDNTSFVVQLASTKGKKASYKILLDKGPAPVVVTANNTPGLTGDVNAPMMAYLDNNKRWLQLQSPVTIANKNLKTVAVNDKANYRSSSIAGPGHADQVINGDDLAYAPSTAEGLNGRIRGGYLVGDRVYLQTSNVISGGGGVSEPMLIVIDGSQQTGTGVNTVAPGDIETVEVLKGPNAAVYGVAGGAGVIVITTRQQKKDAALRELPNGSIQYRPAGFYKARDFYVPKYNVQSSSQKPDLRSTIYWAPNIITDKNGQATLNFTNADGAGSYRVVIEGIDVNGNIGRQVYRYKVQ